MPFKTWVAGEEVLAADFNAYMQQQVVATFPTATARNTAIPSPLEGMVTYLADTNRVEFFDGVAWQAWTTAGRLGYAAITAADVGPGVTTVLASVTFTLATQRRCRIDAHASYSIVTAASNGNTLCRFYVNTVAQGHNFAAAFQLGLTGIEGGAGLQYVTLAAGSHTVDMRAVNGATTPNATMRFAATNGYLAVYDDGPG